jgi:hypothetical protein
MVVPDEGSVTALTVLYSGIELRSTSVQVSTSDSHWVRLFMVIEWTEHTGIKTLASMAMLTGITIFIVCVCLGFGWLFSI